MNDRITIDAHICNERPVITGTRIPVTVTLDQPAATRSAQAVVARDPELALEQVTVLRCCHSLIDHTELEPEAA